MAINADFPMLTFDQANPWLTGLHKNEELYQKKLEDQKNQIMNSILGVKQQYAQPTAQQELMAQMLQNKINEAKAKYAEPSEQEELKKLQLANQYYGPNIESEMSQRRAQTNKINSMLPGELQAQLLENRSAQEMLNKGQAIS